MYILTTLLGALFVAVMAVMMANAIEFLAKGNYQKCIYYFILGISSFFVYRLGYFVSSAIYNITGSKIINELNCDLSNQAFKLSSKTYSDNTQVSLWKELLKTPKE